MLMNQYEDNALRTAPRRKVKWYYGQDLYLMYEIMEACITFGNLADMVKKQIFHGKPKGLETSNYLASRTLTPEQQDLLNGALGLLGEAAEVARLVHDHVFDGKPLDRGAIKDELGDILWYIPPTARAAGTCLSDVGQHNNEKLAKRYPNGFDPNQAH